jgi:adenylate cyclase
MKKKGLRFTIGFKLIFITSLIVSTSLSGIIYFASTLFRGDNVTRAEEITLNWASLISITVKSDFESLVDNAQLTLDSAEPNSVTLVFKDEDILFLSASTRNEFNEITTFNTLPNLSSLSKIGNPNIEIDEIIAAEGDLVTNSFNTEVNVFNASLYFGEPVIGISAPYKIINPGQAESIMLIFVSMNRFLEAVKSQSIYQSFIVNGNGDLIAHFDAEMVKSKANMIDLPIVQKMLKDTIDNGKYNFEDKNGVKFLGSYKKTGFSDIGVVTIVEEDKAFAAVYQMQRRNILITIIVINVAIFILYIFSKTLTRPINRLAEASEKIKEGDYDVKITAKSNDEIGDLTASFKEMAVGLAEREKLKGAFGKFVNKELAEMVTKGELKLGGERKRVAVFFSDIRSFTAISEKLEPEEVVGFLNEYMTKMVECVIETHGNVDKYIGDAIMATWGAPISYGNDTENAVNGALLMRKRLMEFNQGRGGDRKPIIRIGCGINVGPLIAGQIGSDEKMEYTVIGDTVNLASRIEALNKPFGTDILISNDVYKEVKDIYNVEPMQKIRVKGKIEPQQIYAVLSRKDDPNGYKTLQEVRDAVGIDMKGKPTGNVDEKEEKFEIIGDKPGASNATKTEVSPRKVIKKSIKDVKYEVLD